MSQHIAGVRVSSEPGSEPVSTSEAKELLRVDHSDDDTLIGTLITVARRAAELYMGRALITQTRVMTFRRLPCDYRIVVPYPRLISVTSLKAYTDESTQVTVGATEYTVETDPEPGVVLLHGVLPAVTYSDRAVPWELTYTCGYGSSASDVPEDIQMGIRLHVMALYDDRAHAGTVPEAARWLYDPHRMGAF